MKIVMPSFVLAGLDAATHWIFPNAVAPYGRGGRARA
jgi:hypothetical protein